MTQHTNSQDRMAVYSGSAGTGLLGHQQLEEMLKRYEIPKSETEEVAEALNKELEKDENAYEKAVKETIEKYGQETSRWIRFWNRITHPINGYVPNIKKETSPQTQLYHIVLEMQTAVKEGGEELKGLPEEVKQMRLDYANLERKKTELEDQAEGINETLANMPEVINNYQKTIKYLQTYNLLDSECKGELEKLLSSETKEIRGIEIPQVRELYLAEVHRSLNLLQSSNLEITLGLMKEELSLVDEELDSLNQEYDEFKEGFFPALKALHRLKMHYDHAKRMAPRARRRINLNQLREKGVVLTAEKEEAIANLKQAINESRLNAEIAEEIAEEVGLLTAGK